MKMLAASLIGSFGALVALAETGTPLSPNQPPPTELARAAGVELPRYPWHLVNLHWKLKQKTENFFHFAQDITIDRDIPDAYNLYIAPIGLAKIGGKQFYGGLQTNINGWDSKESRTRVHPGKGAIFSRWTSDPKKPIGLGFVRMEEGGLCESAGYEGEFCSVRRPFKWTKGRYRFIIKKGEQEQVKGETHTWFVCEVLSLDSGETTSIGSLRFEGETFDFWAYHTAFVEVYATSKIPRSGIPAVKVTFGYPQINGEPPELDRAFANYPHRGTAAGPACAKVSTKGETVTVELGKIFKPENPARQDALSLKVIPANEIP